MELFYWLFLLMSFLSVSVSLNQFVTNRQVCSMTKIDVQRVRQDNSQWTTTWGWMEGAEVQHRLKAVVLFPHIRGCLEIQTGLVIWPQHYQSLFWFLRHIRISQHAHREKRERERVNAMMPEIKKRWRREVDVQITCRNMERLMTEGGWNQEETEKRATKKTHKECEDKTEMWKKTRSRLR